jgi:hypothetical protein
MRRRRTGSLPRNASGRSPTTRSISAPRSRFSLALGGARFPAAPAFFLTVGSAVDASGSANVKLLALTSGAVRSGDGGRRAASAAAASAARRARSSSSARRASSSAR